MSAKNPPRTMRHRSETAEQRLPKAERALGDELQRIRHALRLHQWEVGAKCGVSARTVLRWENGYRRPTPEQLVSLVNALFDLDPAFARRIAAAAGTSLETLAGVAPASSTVPTTAPPSKETIEHAVFTAAEEIDVPAARLRAPLAKLFRRLGALGISWENASAMIAPPVARPKRG